MEEKTYTEEEAKILAGQITADLGIYILTCIMQKNENPKTEEKFEELFDKYKKK